MNPLRGFRLKCKALFQKPKLDADMDAEMHSHIELQIQENISAGMKPEEARRAAFREFGWVESLKETCREQRGAAWIENFVRDLRFGLRMLWKNPGFTAIVIGILALGIGGTSAIFSLVDAVLLKPSPYRDGDRILEVREKTPSGRPNPISPANLLDWRAQNHVFEEIAAYTGWSRNLSGAGEPEFVKSFQISANFFDVLGGKFLLGRAFLPEEEQVGRNHEVILSHTFWRTKFGADTNAVGRQLLLDGEKFTVVGVVKFYSNSDQSWAKLWTPLTLDGRTAVRDYHFLRSEGRLKPGVTLERAQADMDAIANRLAFTYPESDKGMGIMLKPLREEAVGPQLRYTLLVLLGAIGCLLLLACANVANLMLARTLSRKKEVVVRLALGASRGRLMGQFLIESTLVSLLGGAAGLLLAFVLLTLFTRFAPVHLPQGVEVVVDYRQLLFSLGVSLLTGVLLGLVPAWQASTPSLNEFLKEGSRSASAGIPRHRLQGAVVVLEVATAMVLLVGAGLLIQSFLRLRWVNPGFQPHNVLALEVSLPKERYEGGQQFTDFYSRALENIEAIPGVEAVGLGTGLPVSGVAMGMPFIIEEHPGEGPTHGGSAPFTSISPKYFETLKIPLLKGRSFTQRDRLGMPGITIISQALARRYFQQENPIGKHLLIKTVLPFNQGVGAPVPWEIVGVVGDVKVSGLAYDNADEIYVPYPQSPWSVMYFAARTTGPPLSMVNSVQKAIWEVDKDLPFTYVSTLDTIVTETTSDPRFRTILLSGFAVVALMLASVGIYGVLSYSVAQRTNEIGIRMALGAQRLAVFTLILLQGVLVLLAGVAIGWASAFALTRVMSSLLFETSATDQRLFAVVSLILMSVGFIACYLPARRASRVDPMTVLRHE